MILLSNDNHYHTELYIVKMSKPENLSLNKSLLLVSIAKT